MNRIMKFLETDFLSLALAKFRDIPKVYVKSFVIIFIATNAAFAYHTFYFMLGDHEWIRLIDPLRIDHLWWNGRFTNYMHTWFLTGNNILPVLTNLYAFAGLSFSAIALCIYWKVPKSAFHYSIIGILLSIQPYTLSLLIYPMMTTSNSYLSFFIIMALIFSQKAALCDKRWKIITYAFLAILLNLFVFMAYPAAINTMSVVFIGRIIIDIFMEDGSEIFGIIKRILFKHRYTIASMIVGVLLFRTTWLIFFNSGIILQTDIHNYEITNIKILFAHLMNVSYASFRSLWHYPVTFFPSFLTRLWTSLFIFGVFTILFNVLLLKGINMKTRIIKTISLLILFLLIIVFSKTAAIISPNPIALYEPRVLIYGNIFLLVFPLALIFIQRFNFPKTVAIFISMVLIGICLIQDAKALKVWKFDYEAEKMLWNRVMTRVEENEDYNASKKYRLIFIGKPETYGSHYYGSAKSRQKELEFAKKVGIGELLGMLRGYSRVHVAAAFSFFFPNLFTNDSRWTLLEHLRSDAKGSQAIKDFAFKYKTQINNMQTYPHKNFVFIKDNFIIISFYDRHLKAVKEILNK